MSRVPFAALLLVPLLLASHAGQAETYKASFDCAKAKTPVEKLICASEELAGLDLTIGGLYGQLKNAGDDAAKKAATDEQKAWLRGRLGTCGVPAKTALTKKADVDRATTCLVGLYKDRVAALNVALGHPAGAAEGGTTAEPAAVETAAAPAANTTGDATQVAGAQTTAPELVPAEKAGEIVELRSDGRDASTLLGAYAQKRVTLAGTVVAKSFNGPDNSASLFLDGGMVCTLRTDQDVKRAASLATGDAVHAKGTPSGTQTLGEKQLLVLEPCALDESR